MYQAPCNSAYILIFFDNIPLRFIKYIGYLFVLTLWGLGTNSLSANEPSRFSTAYPRTPSQTLEMQNKLFKAGCYGNQLTNSQLDGSFKIKSRKAIWVYIYTFNKVIFGGGNDNPGLPVEKLKPEIILPTFELDLVKNSPKPFCEEYGQDFLRLYFTDLNEHNPGSIFGKNFTGKCDRKSVGRDYLRGKGADYARFTQALERVSTQFEQIFPGTVPEIPSAVDQNDKESNASETAEAKKAANDTKAHGLPVIDKESVKKSLKKALSQWKGLSFGFGLTERGCIACYRVNDWIYLKNIGQSNGGFLMSFHSIVPVDDNSRNNEKTGLIRWSVGKISLKMLEDVTPWIKLHRSVTANFNRHIEWLSPDKRPEGMKEGDVHAKLRELTPIRDQALRDIIEVLIKSAEKRAVAYAGPDKDTSPLMKEVDSYSKCDGFNGDSVN